MSSDPSITPEPLETFCIDCHQSWLRHSQVLHDAYAAATARANPITSDEQMIAMLREYVKVFRREERFAFANDLLWAADRIEKLAGVATRPDSADHEPSDEQFAEDNADWHRETAEDEHLRLTHAELLISEVQTAVEEGTFGQRDWWRRRAVGLAKELKATLELGVATHNTVSREQIAQAIFCGMELMPGSPFPGWPYAEATNEYYDAADAVLALLVPTSKETKALDPQPWIDKRGERSHRVHGIPPTNPGGFRFEPRPEFEQGYDRYLASYPHSNRAAVSTSTESGQ